MNIQNKPPKRLLDQLQESIRYKHYILRTEQVYVCVLHVLTVLP